MYLLIMRVYILVCDAHVFVCYALFPPHDKSFIRPIRLIFSEDEWSFWREFSAENSLVVSIQPFHDMPVEMTVSCWTWYIFLKYLLRGDEYNYTENPWSSWVNLFQPKTAQTLSVHPFVILIFSRGTTFRTDFQIFSSHLIVGNSPVQSKGGRRLSSFKDILCLSIYIICVFSPLGLTLDAGLLWIFYGVWCAHFNGQVRILYMTATASSSLTLPCGSTVFHLPLMDYSLFPHSLD